MNGKLDLMAKRAIMANDLWSCNYRMVTQWNWY